MKTGFRGTFVISWSQTEIDGQKTAPLQALETGVVWSWTGDAVRVDGPNGLLRLDRGEEGANIRKRAAHMVRKLVGAAVNHKTGIQSLETIEVDLPLMEGGFVVTDGAESYTATVIEVDGSAPLLMFLDELPPKNKDLWVVHASMSTMQRPKAVEEGTGVICFTPGTRIATPQGLRLIEELREGEQIQTRDNGAQQIEWIGARRMTGARLFAMPKLRPIRIRPGALGIERPDQELLVSPEHRMLVRGATARALFNEDEVLVAARDLVNGGNISVDTALKEVTYVHLLLPCHEVIWANGVETESFHPANAALDALKDDDRARLFARQPELAHSPHSYGPHARRNLTASEAAILMHDAA
ncbi:Hint domain-containing protein [Shimia sagamensis]|uniref:Intein N-terminal splicing region n=1 Tax=Shimia sagamensis TaxID=1566352 RepID=A0ABY1P5U4_9RHOB|nr:Hint domain-containing protein [Shimia sagamensis]SMP26696.1 intein N-terminal splicing region [Shimia sagamensis]